MAAMGAAVLLLLTGCSGEIVTEELSGPYVDEDYEITAPEGWVKSETGGNVVFITADYPEHKSYIMVGRSDQKQVAKLLENRDEVIGSVEEQLVKNFGEEAAPKISVFEETELDGRRCVRTVLDYVEEEQKVHQEQYSVDLKEGTAAFTFTTVGDEDFSEEFEEAAGSIKLK